MIQVSFPPFELLSNLTNLPIATGQYYDVPPEPSYYDASKQSAAYGAPVSDSVLLPDGSSAKLVYREAPQNFTPPAPQEEDGCLAFLAALCGGKKR
jgi:hypothetical protein